MNLLKVIDSAISRISIDDNSILHSNENEISAPLLSACCDIRDKLRVAIDIAGSISSTNIECLLHVLALKREHAVTVEKHSKEVEVCLFLFYNLIKSNMRRKIFRNYSY